ncbi:FRG domain-containing protein [Formosa sediminum]|nr:FRG domain-containing protein [Formosa sediminum]
MVVKEINISLQKYFEIASTDLKSDKYIYRGQTNSFLKGGYLEWKVFSSYNRNEQFKKIMFCSFLNQQLETNLFDIYYRNNQFVTDKKLNKLDLRSKLYYLQHYGIPTCLIDFTHNPLVALYFAMSSLNAVGNRNYCREGFPNFYPENCSISIYQINYKVLIEALKLSVISSNLVSEYYGKFQFETNILNKGKKKIHLGIDVFPESNISGVDNFNLKKQEGAFILYDNQRNDDYDLIEFLCDYFYENEIELDEPIVKIFKIKYNELYKSSSSKHPNLKSAFNILEEKKKTGNYLFNDIQGLKYDLIFFNER